MRLITLLALTLLSSTLAAQVEVGGKVPGQLWRTSKVSGEVEMFHPWGRTVVVPIKDAWVTIDRGRITIGARSAKPVLDGKPQDGYMMANMSGQMQTEWPGQHIQTIVDTSITGIGDKEEFRITKTAMISMKDGKPESLAFTCLEYATFDVVAFIEKLRHEGGILAARDIDSMAGFDKNGFRQRTFYAVFSQ